MDANVDLSAYRNSNKLWTRARMTFLIAHEYGHYVQELTGVLQASHTRGRATGREDARLLESRRRELQATCLSAVYLGADRAHFPARGPWMTKWYWLISHRGDAWNPKRTHGSPANNNYWARRGLSGNPASCTTYTATSAQVA